MLRHFYHQIMNGTSGSSGKTQIRGVSLFLVTAAIAAPVSRGSFSLSSFLSSGEKGEFFKDPAVQTVLVEHGYQIQVTTPGPRRIATELGAFTETMPEHVPAVAPPDHEALEELIARIPSSYSPFLPSEKEKQ